MPKKHKQTQVEKTGKKTGKAANGQGTTYQLPNGTWRWRITAGRNAHGDLLRFGGVVATEQEAREKLENCRVDLRHGRLSRATGITVGQHLRQWLESREAEGELRPKTLLNYQQIVEHHLIPVLGQVRIEALTTKMIQEFYAGLRVKRYFRKRKKDDEKDAPKKNGRRKHKEKQKDEGRLLAQGTLNEIHATFRAALNAAVRDGLLVRSPLVGAVRPVSRLPKHRGDASRRAWDKTTVRRFLTVAGEDYFGVMFGLTIVCGLRRGEVAALRWEHVDLRDATLSIREARTVLSGTVISGPPKSETSDRVIHLSPSTVDMLRRHREFHKELREEHGPAWNPDGYLFVWPDGRPLRPDSINPQFARLCKLAGVPRIRVHDLRHTGASLLLAAGVPLEVVSKMLGHHKPSFTLDVYRTVYEAERREHAKGMEDLLGDANEDDDE